MASTAMKARRFWLLTIYVFGVAMIIITRIFRSEHIFQGHEANLVLGSLPNFIAAACIPALYMSWRKRYVGIKSGLVGAVMALVVVLCWEFIQLSRSEMSFDTNDIVATIFGCLSWLLAWPVIDKSLPVA